MPNLYVVMGNSNVGKSRTIRALTGVYRSSICPVALHQGDTVEIFVQVPALQESRISPRQFTAGYSNYENILLALWIRTGQGCLDGQTYLREFQRAGWNVTDIIVLSTNAFRHTVPGLPEPYPIPNSRRMPANQIAHEIRDRWQWL